MNHKDIMKFICVVGVILNILGGALALISGESSQGYVMTLLLWMILGNQYKGS